MAHPSFQSLDTTKIDLENKRKLFFRVLTTIVIVLAILQVGMVAVTKSGADALLGSFGSLFIVLSGEAEHNERKVLLMILAFACLAGSLQFSYG